MTGRTLIVPCAGRSSRFPNLPPKWMLIHPEGGLMVERAIAGSAPNRFQRIVFTIVKEHDEKFDASLVLHQAFQKLGDKLEIVVLPTFTAGQAETVAETVQKAHVTGPILIRDSDNDLAWNDRDDTGNFVVTGDLAKRREVSNVAGKSFVKADENGIVYDIVEKKVVSETFCAGAYQFASATEFCAAFDEMRACRASDGEAYISHVIAWMLTKKDAVFRHYDATAYQDWGTLKDWLSIMQKSGTILCDIDGILIEEVGPYGQRNWSTCLEPLDENIAALRKSVRNGADLVLMTARDEEHRTAVEAFLKAQDLHCRALIMGCRRGCKTVIAPLSSIAPYPMAKAINAPEGCAIEPYLTDFTG